MVLFEIFSDPVRNIFPYKDTGRRPVAMDTSPGSSFSSTCSNASATLTSHKPQHTYAIFQLYIAIITFFFRKFSFCQNIKLVTCVDKMDSMFCEDFFCQPSIISMVAQASSFVKGCNGYKPSLYLESPTGTTETLCITGAYLERSPIERSNSAPSFTPLAKNPSVRSWEFPPHINGQ